MQELTPRQAVCLTVIEASITEHGYPPTYREIAEAMGLFSTNAVNDLLRALERKGHIKRGGAAKSRAIQLVQSVKVGGAEPWLAVANAALDRLQTITCLARAHGFDGEDHELEEWLELLFTNVQRKAG
jgi:SOS-response transcriptional repressor LexA